MQILCPFFELQSHEIGEEEHIFEDYLRERDKNLLLSLLSSTAMEWKKIQMLFWIFCLLSLHCQMHSWLTNMFGPSKFKRKDRKRTSKDWKQWTLTKQKFVQQSISLNKSGLTRSYSKERKRLLKNCFD